MPEVVRLLIAGATIITMDTSAYSLRGMTASGTMTRPGVAACGMDITLGTLLFAVDGDAPYVAVRCLDRGRLVGPGKVDVWMASRRAALAWGRRNVRWAMVR